MKNPVEGRPLVSVVTSFLNEEAFLLEAIESVIGQTYENWELLLVDDGSRDGSSRIAREFARAYGPKIRYLEHEGHRNKGTSPSRNAGLSQSAGELVAFLDADDVWMPEKLTFQVSLMERERRVGMICGASLYWNSWENSERKDKVVRVGVEQNRVFEPPELMESLYPLGKGAAPAPTCLLVRKEVIDGLGGFEDEFGSGMFEDQAFLSKVYLAHPVFVSDKVCDKYRIRPGSVCATTLGAGEYQLHRRHYLTWLERYLDANHVSHRRTRRLLRKELARPAASVPGKTGGVRRGIKSCLKAALGRGRIG